MFAPDCTLTLATSQPLRTTPYLWAIFQAARSGCAQPRMLRHRLLRLRTTQHRLHTRGKLHAWAQPWTRGTPRLPSPAKVFTARYPGRATDGSLRPTHAGTSRGFPAIAARPLEVAGFSTTRIAERRAPSFTQRDCSGLSKRLFSGYMLRGIGTTEQGAVI